MPEIFRQALLFDCAGSKLVGVVRSPAGRPNLGVIVVVGGPQYRIGSHRQFVQLTEGLAASGVATLCFDFRGMGDSEGEPRSFEEVDEDIEAAIGALLSTVPSLQSVVLWGLCGGASAALLYCQRQRDLRVRALALVNPWVRNEKAYAVTRVKHYYFKRLIDRSFWTKLIGGGVRASALSEFGRTVRKAFVGKAGSSAIDGSADTASLSARLAQAWSDFRAPVLLVLSGDDYTAKEFLEVVGTDLNWTANLTMPSVTRIDAEGADHTFSGPEDRRLVELATKRWLKEVVSRNTVC